MGNAAKEAWKKANDSGMGYNFLTGEEMPKAVAKLGKYSEPVPDKWSGTSGGGLKDLWGSASEEQKATWTKGGGAIYYNLMNNWNNGMVDGVKHNYNMRDILDAIGFNEQTGVGR